MIGTAGVSCGLLSYEILTTRLLAVVMGGDAVILAVAFAMMGMGVSASVMSLDDGSDRRQARLLGLLAALLALSYAGVLVALTAASGSTNSLLD